MSQSHGWRGRHLYAAAEPLLIALSAILRIFPRPLCGFTLTLCRHVPTVVGVAIRYVLLRRLAKRCGRCVAVFEGVYMCGLRNAEFGDHVSVHPMCYLDATGGLAIGSDVSIAHSSTVMTTEHDYQKSEVATRDAPLIHRATSIGDDVWVGCGARVLAGSHLGPGSVVGAGAVVTKPVAATAVVGGVPARVLREPGRLPISRQRAEGSATKRPKLTYVVTTTGSLGLLRGQLRRMRQEGFDVELICSPGEGLEQFASDEGVAHRELPIAREIAPVSDLVALVRLCIHLWCRRPDIVNVSTPKAGMLGAVAGWLARVPVRVYVLRGLRLETTRGLRRQVLAGCEWLASRCSTRVLCVSHSLRNTFVQQGLADADKAVVLGEGASNGVAIDSFPVPGSADASRLREVRRTDLGIKPDAWVFGAVGRMTRDKGVADLVEAFSRVRESLPDAHLLLVGPFEKHDALQDSLRARIESEPQIHAVGRSSRPAEWMTAMDCLVHPSFREGFPNVVLEGGAIGLPVVGRRVTGVVDSVVDGQTGRLVGAIGPGELAEAMLAYAREPHTARRHGAAGRQRVEACFTNEHIWPQLTAQYRQLLDSAGVESDLATPEDASLLSAA